MKQHGTTLQSGCASAIISALGTALFHSETQQKHSVYQYLMRDIYAKRQFALLKKITSTVVTQDTIIVPCILLQQKHTKQQQNKTTKISGQMGIWRHFLLVLDETSSLDELCWLVGYMASEQQPVARLHLVGEPHEQQRIAAQSWEERHTGKDNSSEQVYWHLSHQLFNRKYLKQSTWMRFN